MDFALRTTDLHKSYGSHAVLRGASLQLRRGERLGLLGPNGAGKTTLIRCLTGRTRPDSGTIELDGRPLPAHGGRHTMGLVPQELALYADLTARENLQAFARFHGLRGRLLKQRVEWALQWTGLQSRADDPVGRFSGGMQRRVNLACGVMHAPDVILLDEPTVGVDPQSRQRIFQMLDELKDQGASIVLTTHQLDDAETRCDRIVIFDHGRVVAEGTLADLIEGTIGTARQVRLRVAAAPRAEVPGWQSGERPDELLARVEDVSLQLPRLLDAVRRAGSQATDLAVTAPSLNQVFLQLTGNRLRDE
ncbi:ABC transporter ATP-binding protein [Roseimaritima ulvae]|uniref:Daunorubicin/doxorubicin resistance ATP-binding protein DrrA n=1 Tax=Roseimaritima ulvae TaxID=980254 RepID=A0A5B9QNG9_9BACT|nr:ABC transporter ATP-binding protein [Roseimaritima ulvae]QEG39025.1 Daunorubicin/doxorubicin resistance ATP-binding protein DrrA [Roseimaritima ulvae]